MIAIVIAIVALVIAFFGKLTVDQRFSRVSARLDAIEARLRAPPPLSTAAEPAVTRPPVQEPIAPSPEFAATPSPPEPVAPVAAATAVPWFARIEERLLRRWFVWLGAITLALGVVFLVKYTIERGLFGPTARIVAGVVIGMALIAAGEAARRRPPPLRQGAALQPDAIPTGLSAAGIVGLFASFDAGYALYGLIPPFAAFFLLAATSAGAAVLSLVHGRALALLGFIGGFVVPLLVTSPHPTAAPLLAYVLAVTVGALMLLRWQRWAWLELTVVVGAMAWGWTALFIGGGELARGLYFLVVPAAFVWLIEAEPASAARPRVVWAAAILGALLMALNVFVADYLTTTIVIASALAALFAALGWRDAGYDRLAWIGVVMQLLLLAGWEFDWSTAFATSSSYFYLTPPPLLQTYLGFAAANAAAFGFGGLVIAYRAKRPERWALAAAAVPVLVMAIAYWRVERLDASLPWAAVALALALADLIIAERWLPQRDDDAGKACLAVFAVAMIASLSLAMTMSLRLGWLTVALSLQLPAMVWLYRRLAVRALKPAALIIAVIVLVRLLLNPAITDYDIGERPIFNALIYTYGVPWLAFLAAARGFRQDGEDGLVWLLQAGTMALGMALVSLEIRHFVNGTIRLGHYDLLEQGLQSDAWLAVGYALLPRDAGPEPRVRAAAWRIIAGLAAVHLLLLPVLAGNPLLVAARVGSWPLFDAILFAYGVPAVLAVLYARAFVRLGFAELAKIAAVAALVLGFLEITLEVRHLFHGEILVSRRPMTDGEWWTYSAVWLLFALALFLDGLYFRRPTLRLAGLAVGALVAGKVFVFDMAALSGLYRAASFLGLGASLVGLGFLHQRLAAPERA